ncbi:DMT family transporter [Halobacillus fulvus]|nr:DMT family transporter [Halobacillus fulvus]
MKKYGALISLSLIWGLSFVFIKYLVTPAGVWGTVFLRCAAGALILLPFVWKQRRLMKGTLPYRPLLIVGLFNAGLPWGLIALSETQITSNTAAVLNALTPIGTALIGFFFFSIVLFKRQWIGIVLGFAGVLVILDFQVTRLLTDDLIGIGTMVLATICYGFASQYTKKHLQQTGIVLIAMFSLVVGALTGLVGMLVTATPISASIWTDPSSLVAIVGLGCLGSGVAHLLFYYMVKEGSAEFATSVTYLIPLTAMFWGSVLLEEPVTGHLIIGLTLIFVGVYLATRKQKRSLPYKKARQAS